ncbi:hypothetical protein IFM89_006791 [Coptis chinensis]|uniref:Nas2 N-terminal domain-containing protein n=1 Tax=Coptis chinensis TaxID=261450 RepID=A0A835IAN8_9MAGN|nr:hypothetical protein IFM89_006791 [Coptis chinensis]
MVAPNLKVEAMCLIEKREAIETEMNAIISTLTQPSGPGLTSNLLYFEGFPRSDIDVHAVRAQRHHLVGTSLGDIQEQEYPGGLATQVMKSMLNDVNCLHCKHRCLVRYGGGSVGDDDFITVNTDTLYNILMDADYMNMKSMLDIAIQRVPDITMGRSPEYALIVFRISYNGRQQEKISVKVGIQENEGVVGLAGATSCHHES